MIRFECDYSQGAYPPILEKLLETNMEQTSGYGTDPYCENARALIKKACKREDLDIHFLVGGTQTNKTVIASVLRPHQAVYSADTGHINTHESGAIEATGHKVISVPSIDGKITAQEIKKIHSKDLADSSREHCVQPAMVYISQPTEYGTLYSLEELEELYSVCNEFNLPLFVDGARLGYGLMSPENNVTLNDLCRLCDVFYIGGTKVGALFGEAVVFCNEKFNRDFRYIIKQNGGLLAKGRLLGIQFQVLFEDGAYLKIAKQANEYAAMIEKAFIEKGYKKYINSTTNQQFFVLPNDVIKKLQEQVTFLVWDKYDETHSIVRFCTSWATTLADVECLITKL